MALTTNSVPLNLLLFVHFFFGIVERFVHIVVSIYDFIEAFKDSAFMHHLVHLNVERLSRSAPRGTNRRCSGSFLPKRSPLMYQSVSAGPNMLSVSGSPSADQASMATATMAARSSSSPMDTSGVTISSKPSNGRRWLPVHSQLRKVR